MIFFFKLNYLFDNGLYAIGKHQAHQSEWHYFLKIFFYLGYSIQQIDVRQSVFPLMLNQLALICASVDFSTLLVL